MMSTIYVLGLGPGDLSGLSLGAFERLSSGLPLYLRTAVHPAADDLRKRGFAFHAFDELYETGESFQDVYEGVVAAILEATQTQGDVVYAVPGHPLMAEQTVQLLLQRCADPALGVAVHIGPGQSFLDAMFSALRIDPIDGLLVLDGTSLQADCLQPALHTLIAQVYSQDVAADVKITLMDVYPDLFPITVIRAAGVAGVEHMVTIPLYELDRLEWIDHLTSVYLSASTEPDVLARDPFYLAHLVRQLRAPGVSSWYRQQTHASLGPSLLQVASDVAHASDIGDPEALVASLGDLYLQVLLHAQMASEIGDFSLRDVYATLVDKLREQ
jgi:tetrapyrrole methylase family protein/MazG family protein